MRPSAKPEQLDGGMSKDARNSLIAWGSVLGLCGLVWLDNRYHLTGALPELPAWTNWIPLVTLPILIIWEIIRSIRAERREKAGG